MAKKKSPATPDQQIASPAADPSPENTRRNDPPEHEGEIQIKAPPKLEARLSMVDELANRVHQTHAEESGDAVQSAAADEGQDEQPVATTVDEPIVTDPPAVAKVKIKVNGREQEVEEDRVREAGIRALQKESAADERLQLATERLRQAEEILRAAGDKTGNKPTESSTAEPSTNVDADVDALARAIQFGTEDEVKEAVKTILTQARSNGTPQAIPSADAIVEQVNARLEFNTALQQFQKDFSDVWTDDNLRRLAFQEDQKLQAEIRDGQRDPMSYSERFAEAGKAVREWRDKIAGKPGTAQVQIDSGKAARKAAAPSIPTAGARPSGSPTAPPAPPSPTNIVAEMRRARGQL